MWLWRASKWAGGILAALLIVAAAGIALFGWNWLRAPVSQLAEEKTGRTLTIGGDVEVDLGWPLLRVRTGDVRFANPPWARQEHMFTAEAVELSLDLPALFGREVMIDVLTLRRARIFLEANAAGQKSWLLDREQKDENARLPIGRLAFEGRIEYDEPARQTSIVAEMSPRQRTESQTDHSPATDISVSAQGKYRGLPLALRASGGPLLALRDKRHPYPFAVEATIGSTAVKAHGSVTGVTQPTALDAQVSVHGDSLAQLYPLLGIALPETPAYRSAGRIIHSPGIWRYQEFSAHIGNSDFSGTLQVDSAQKTPFLSGTLNFGKLELADLGPAIGGRRDDAPEGAARDAPRQVLPDIPFRTQRWASVNADLKLAAGTIVRAKALPLDNLATRLRLRDSLLTLDPLVFGIAGGTLAGRIQLDGRHDPIRAEAKLAARRIVFDKLFPGFEQKKAKFGQLTGEIEIAGAGNSVARMLATANGSGGMVVAGGEVSRLAMEMAGLHVLEVIILTIAGDRPIRIRCGMAGFRVQDGVVQAGPLLFDTEISNVVGGGTVDLGRERLDLTLVPRSKELSLIALRSPLHVRGSFAKPEISIDRGQLAARGLGALVLGAANPLLALVPLIEAGPGEDSDCGQLMRSAMAKAGKEGKEVKRATK